MIKKIGRDPIRPDKEPCAEIEIWQPCWKCFCCHDRGIIVAHLAKMAIDGYNPNHDKLPRCVAPGCNSGEQFDSEQLSKSVDYRLDAAICQELDAIERTSWQQTIKDKQKNIQRQRQTQSLISQFAQSKNLRPVDRSPEEQTKSERKHQEALAE